MSVKVEYSSNNSGGNWWLTDKDWSALEKAGWEIEWYKDSSLGMGVREDGRFLGALAGGASKTFNTLREGVEEFEDITGEDPSAEGCNCCGPPHSFSGTDEDGNYLYVDRIVSTEMVYPD